MLREHALHALRTLLTKGQVFTDSATLVAYEVDAGRDKGIPEGVVFPHNVSDVIQVMRWAREYRIPVIARGSGTGLSGGAVADRGGIIVEFVHMNQILAFDPQGHRMQVEPALINLRLDERARTEGLYFPPDPASQRASTIGGNVAENSGGPHCFKYGVTTNYVMGMQIVSADGRVVQLGGSAFDYPEYDLCGLVTGSEGTLGLITAITLRLVRNPPGVKTLLAVFNSIEQAGAAVSAVIAAGLMPATMEMMDHKIIGIIEPFAHAHLPLDAGAVLIVDIDGYPASLEHQVQALKHILLQHDGYDIRVARDEEERAKIWLARKSAAGAIAREVPSYYTVDVTVPRSCLVETLAKVNQICERYQLRVGHVFHAGDGNLHPMILIPEPDNAELIERVHQAGWEMVKYCVGLGGSLTGEHGVGIEKREYMSLMHEKNELLAMWDVKQVFDPDCLLNPGKIFPSSGRDEFGPFAGYVPHHSELKNVLPLSISPCWSPSTIDEIAQGLPALALSGHRLSITGATHVTQKDPSTYSLYTGAFNSIETYAPDDLYVTVGAGTRLTAVQAFLATEGKQLALASPWPEATVGGLAAANANSPLRMRYGSLRDQILCATVVLADGRVIRTGRPIVKNVAGFDMTKVFIGSFGTLGFIADLSLKISAQPRLRRTLLFPAHHLYQALRWSGRLLPLALNASAILISKGCKLADLPSCEFLLVYTAEGIQEDVDAELTEVRQTLRAMDAPEPLSLTTLTGTDIWSGQLQATEELSVLVRIGLPVSGLEAYMHDICGFLQEDCYLVDCASGSVYLRRVFTTPADVVTWLDTVRRPALVAGGYAVVMDLPDAWSGLIERWGYLPDSLTLMRRLQRKWDQHGLWTDTLQLIPAYE